MLVLSRKPGQKIVINGEIEITILDVQGQRIRLGFQAPADIPIQREEVYRRVKNERPAAPIGAGPAPFLMECI